MIDAKIIAGAAGVALGTAIGYFIGRKSVYMYVKPVGTLENAEKYDSLEDSRKTLEYLKKDPTPLYEEYLGELEYAGNEGNHGPVKTNSMINPDIDELLKKYGMLEVNADSCEHSDMVHANVTIPQFVEISGEEFTGYDSNDEFKQETLTWFVKEEKLVNLTKGFSVEESPENVVGRDILETLKLSVNGNDYYVVDNFNLKVYEIICDDSPMSDYIETSSSDDDKEGDES